MLDLGFRGGGIGFRIPGLVCWVLHLLHRAEHVAPLVRAAAPPPGVRGSVALVNMRAPQAVRRVAVLGRHHAAQHVRVVRVIMRGLGFKFRVLGFGVRVWVHG